MTAFAGEGKKILVVAASLKKPKTTITTTSALRPREGDIISPSGILTGGSGNGSDRSLLRNRREIGELTKEVEELAVELQEGQERRKRNASLIAQWEEELLRLRSQLHLTELRINGLKKDDERFEGELHQVEERRKVLAFDRENLRAEASEAREKIVGHEAEMKVLEGRESELNREMDDARRRGEALRADLETRERSLTEQKIRLTSLEEKREANLQTLSRLETFLADHSRENKTRLADAENCERESQALTDQIAAEEEALKALYAECEGLEGSLSSRRGDHAEKELKTRYEFLTTQAADLNASLETLQKTITRINAISRKRFSETFEGVNRCFQEVFARLFPGGRAELFLTDESDLLDAGVDIDIRIPGKRAQNVTLLSGGEKSLSAIALIFSILLYRPVPFLLLDEVDAALDDSNIVLFKRLVKETAAQSQILMITHNKATMEIVDSLYGVTMPKQGISTLVSVNLN